MAIITLTHNDVELHGEMRLPAGAGPFPAVLVMHNALGIGRHVIAIAEKLAAQGYAAVVTDMFGNPASGDAHTNGSAFDVLVRSPETLRARTVAWFDAVAARPEIDASRIAAIGYCFGGKCVLELARSCANVQFAISFHGLLTTHAPAAKGAIKGHVIAYCGAKDPYAPLSDIDALRAELEAAEAHYQITTFGGVEHAFTDPLADAMGRPGIKYDVHADALSWAGTVATLRAL